MNVLIIYPHGLGDCLMLTPALREYQKTFGFGVSVAILKRFESSQILNNNPHIEKVFPVLKDAWNDFANPSIGFNEVQKQGNVLAFENNYKPVFINHPPPQHKILLCAQQLGVNLSSTKIDIYINDEERMIADGLIKKFVGDNKYGFIQTETGVPAKNLPVGFGKKWLEKMKGLKHVIEIGKEFQYTDYNINVQFEILRRASAVCIPDSVFYHACSGLNKDIDFVYFAPERKVYSRVHNLNKNIVENVYNEIPMI